jgi:3-phenylpropionate/trans-cinnamate dioxygenase ferredoxin reductase subunit
MSKSISGTDATAAARDIRNIVIVGGGECAGRAALHLRECGFVGSVTIVGDEPYSPYERPPLSKSALSAASPPELRVALSEERARELDIELELGSRALRLDRADRADGAGSLVLSSGEALPFDRALIATGARPRTLSIPGAEHALTLRTFDDAMRLRARVGERSAVLVIGAGFIGLEVAASLRQGGHHVVVVEAADRVLARSVPVAVSDLLVERHRVAGVDVRLGIAPSAISFDAESFSIVLDDGSMIRADVVVAGIGVTPGVEVAAASGVDCDNGILADGHLETSLPGVFAAGDCCAAPHSLYPGRPLRLEAWRNAHDQALVAAENILGGVAEWAAVPSFWSDQFDLTLHVAGIASFATREVCRERGDGLIVRFGLDGADRVVSVTAVGRGTSASKDVRLGEMLIARRAVIDDAVLADAGVPLKSLVRA